MILSQKQIEEIAAAVTRDFNEFFFGCETDKARIARATPIDQFATDYLSLDVSFARLSSDGSIYGLTAYENTEYIIEESNAREALLLEETRFFWMRALSSRDRCGSSAANEDLRSPTSAPTRSFFIWKQTRFKIPAVRSTPHEKPTPSGSLKRTRTGTSGRRMY